MRFIRVTQWTACAALVAVAVSGCSRSAQSHIDRGDARLADGRIDAAVLEFRSAVEKDPMSAPARQRLAAAFIRQGNFAGALAETVRAADLLPGDVDAQLRAGSMLLMSGRPQDALGRADKALTLSPDTPEALVLRGNALAGLNTLDAAAEQIQRAIALKPLAEWQANLGVLQHARGRVPEAEAAFRQAVATDPKSLAAQMTLAKFLSGTGRPDEAEVVFKVALALDPENAAANQALADFYLQSNRAPDAEPYFQKATATGEPSTRLALVEYYVGVRRHADALAVLEQLSATPQTWAVAKARTAELLYGDGKQAEAHRAIDEVIAKQPAYSPARVVRGRFRLAEGNTDQAIAEGRQAVKYDARNADAHLLVAVSSRARRDLDGAAASYTEVLRLNPMANGVQVQLAEIELQRGNLSPAVQLAEQAVQREPDRLDARLVLARGLLARGDLERATATTRELVEKFPQDGAAHAQAGLLAMRRGDRAGARAALEKALTLDAGLVQPLAALAALDIAEGQAGRARVRVEERLKTTPRDSALLVVAATTWGAGGDHAQAEEFLRRAIDADPSNLEAYERLGRLYVFQKRLDAALAEFDKLAARQPGRVGPPTMAGLILQAQGKQDEARQRYERLVEADPHAAVASNNLAWMYATRGEQLDRALQLAQAAKAVLPDNAAVNDTLGFVYIRKQLPSLAIPPLRLAVTKEPGNPEFHYHLGLAYSGAGDKEAARASLRKALELKADFSGADEAREVLRSLG